MKRWDGIGGSAAAALAALALSACADLGKFIWVQDYRAAAPKTDSFIIARGDVIQMRMFGQEAFTTRARVRADGKISLPLLNDVVAAGYGPLELGQQLETRYKDFVKVPTVTVSIEDVRPLSVPVAGEVLHSGIVSADRGATLFQVLLLAGGLNDFAHRDRIFVLRTQPEVARIRFNWEAMLRDGPGARFEMHAGDAVVVE